LTYLANCNSKYGSYQQFYQGIEHSIGRRVWTFGWLGT